MNLKRVLTTLIGLPVVGALLILGNTYVIDFFLLAVAIICMHEYFGVIEKVAHPIKWIGYLSTIIVAIPAFLSIEILMKTVIFSIPIILLILFLKYNFLLSFHFVLLYFEYLPYILFQAPLLQIQMIPSKIILISLLIS